MTDPKSSVSCWNQKLLEDVQTARYLLNLMENEDVTEPSTSTFTDFSTSAQHSHPSTSSCGEDHHGGDDLKSELKDGDSIGYKNTFVMKEDLKQEVRDNVLQQDYDYTQDPFFTPQVIAGACDTNGWQSFDENLLEEIRREKVLELLKDQEITKCLSRQSSVESETSRNS